MSVPEVHGFVHDKFAAVRDAFAANLASGADIGASFAATIDGEPVADLWGGHRDEHKTKPWEKDTIVNVYSTTKTMCALTALLCADQGLIDFKAPVATYWPEFAQNGKDKVTVGHLMSHSAGVPGWEKKVTVEDIYDWNKAVGLLAEQEPWWEPGTVSGYHALTQGYLVGEVVRRVKGKSLGTVFRDEIARPLDADFHIGLPASEDARVGDLIPPTASLATAASSDVAKRTFNNPVMTALEPRTRAWRAAEIPAAGGIGNARSVALVQSILANDGTVRGQRFMSKEGARKALEPQVEGTDLILGAPIKFGLGYGLPGDMLPVPHPNTIFWGGWGGSLIVVDYDAKMTMAYVPNRMVGTTTGDSRVAGMMFGMFAGLGG
ncbi:MAG: beta-lactamase family protein [Alphaproteobacteria bacterium]|nr:beta-lactamase family protein [Alphaproteobacteria bacterium]